MTRLLVSAPLTATVPPGSHVIPLAEDISAWVVTTFPSDAAYQAWYDRQPPATRQALSVAAGVLDKVDAGWPAGTVETAYAATTAQAELIGLYDRLTDPTGRPVAADLTDADMWWCPACDVRNETTQTECVGCGHSIATPKEA